MTQVRQINRTRDAITVFDELSCETIVLTIIAEDCDFYAVHDDDVAYQLIPDGDYRWELSPESVGSTFDGPDTRFVVEKKGDGTCWEIKKKYAITGPDNGVGSGRSTDAVDGGDDSYRFDTYEEAEAELPGLAECQGVPEEDIDEHYEIVSYNE